jgi:hypothetical protein
MYRFNKIARAKDVLSPEIKITIFVKNIKISV